MAEMTTRIFLVRGLAREARHWGLFLHKLAKSFPGTAIHPLEIPGAGHLRDVTSPLSVEGCVKAMRREFLRHKPQGDDCRIIGLSLGGMIAAHWLEKHPEDFKAAVLINTSCTISPFYRRMQLLAGIHLLVTLFYFGRYRREKRLASLLCNLADPKKVAQEWAEISRTAPVSFINILRQLYAAATFETPVKIEAPTLILSSRRDRLVSVKSSEDIANLWNKDHICHEWAGHDLTTDDPDWCISQLLSWHPFPPPELR